MLNWLTTTFQPAWCLLSCLQLSHCHVEFSHALIRSVQGNDAREEAGLEFAVSHCCKGEYRTEVSLSWSVKLSPYKIYESGLLISLYFSKKKEHTDPKSKKNRFYNQSKVFFFCSTRHCMPVCFSNEKSLLVSVTMFRWRQEHILWLVTLSFSLFARFEAPSRLFKSPASDRKIVWLVHATCAVCMSYYSTEDRQKLTFMASHNLGDNEDFVSLHHLTSTMWYLMLELFIDVVILLVTESLFS